MQAEQVSDVESELDAPSLRSPGSVGAVASLRPATLTFGHNPHLPGRRHGSPTTGSEGGDHLASSTGCRFGGPQATLWEGPHTLTDLSRRTSQGNLEAPRPWGAAGVHV